MNKSFYQTIIHNLQKIMRDNNLSQAQLAEYAGTSASQISKIINGTVKLSINQLSNIARELKMTELDVITYPDKYEKVGSCEDGPAEVFVQLKLKKEKKDQVLKLVFGENDIEILNR